MRLRDGCGENVVALRKGHRSAIGPFPGGVVESAAQRVDEPHALRVPGTAAAGLLGDHRVVGTLAPHNGEDGVLGRGIHFGGEIGSGLPPSPEVAAHPRAMDLRSGLGGADGGLRVGRAHGVIVLRDNQPPPSGR